MLRACNYPKQALISIDATRYTPFGETGWLKDGDETIVVLYSGNHYDHEKIRELLNKKTFDDPSLSLVHQTVRAPSSQ
ncbi:MAG: DUF5718 family protein [Campylobacterales bacterium]